MMRLLTANTLPHTFLDPHLAASWVVGVDVLVTEAGRLRALDMPAAEDVYRYRELISTVRQGLSAIQRFEPLKLMGKLLSLCGKFCSDVVLYSAEKLAVMRSMLDAVT